MFNNLKFKGMKKLFLCGLLAMSSISLIGNNSHKTPKHSPGYVFNSTPTASVMDAATRDAYLKAVVPMTIIVVGSGGYDPNSQILCPISAYEKCGTIVTAFVNGTYGPDAKVEDARTLRHYAGIIARPITDSDGNVVNFRFSSLTPID